jgi:hypothetical protein
MAGIIATNDGLLRSALLEAGFSVYPKTVEHKRSAWEAKTDQIDASLLAKQCLGQNALKRRPLKQPNDGMVLPGPRESFSRMSIQLFFHLSESWLLLMHSDSYAALRAVLPTAVTTAERHALLVQI